MSEQKPVQHIMTVSSAFGSPNPANGVTYQEDKQQISCSVNSHVSEGINFYKCKGWVGTGSVPASGQATNVTFPITSDSKIEWQWEKIAFLKELKDNSVWQSEWGR